MLHFDLENDDEEFIFYIHLNGGPQDPAFILTVLFHLSASEFAC